MQGQGSLANIIANKVVIEGPNGELLAYNGQPALGNLIASIAAAAFTDDVGNNVQAGICLYGADKSTVRIQDIVVSGFLEAGIWMGTGDASESSSGHLVTLKSGSAGTTQLITDLLSPKVISQPNASDGASVEVISWSADGTTAGPQVSMQIVKNGATTGSFVLGDSGAIIGGPFASLDGTPSNPTILRTDTWHNLSPVITGYNVLTCRYRLGVESLTRFDIQIQAGAGGGTAGVYTITTTLPATHQPLGNSARSYPLGYNGTITAGQNFGSILVDEAGSANAGRIRVQVPGLPASTILGDTVFWPVD